MTPSPGIEPGTLVEGARSPHCIIPAPPNYILNRLHRLKERNLEMLVSTEGGKPANTD